ncbi:hypothetical protein [Mycobacterium arosiense]|uniref:Uncharacterized protein n=1 Tax=Mycobacterium arosiense ATCC BAA-1401 = DSM 45069 TaxID=1265311 RepID=A0A1W9Z8S5_MYCAI|nr:hypothetical protein [Mycobacterium arosiense]ORA09106.1 hypothetical protein BST14_22655 [Mycobacterium arosiense ATCC BAA-1401 = DSM 45069]
MTDAGESAEDGTAGEDPAAARSRRKPASDERDRHFERVEKVLYWVRRTRAAKLAPDRFLTPLDYLINLNMQYRSHRRALAGFRWGDEDLCTVPPTDHVQIPSLFIVELFTPSVKGNLDRAIKRNRWDTKRLRMYGRHYMPTLDEARSGDGWPWWNLGEVVRRGSNVMVGDAVRRKMPIEFDRVELKALQISQGITAVMAKFDLNDAAISRLDAAWHRDYQPEMYWGKWGGEWPRPLMPDFVAFRRVQEERGRLHDAARQWFSAKWPGFFATNGQPQPLLDVVLLNEISAYPETRPAEGVEGAVRALGLPHTVYVQRSTKFPAMTLGERQIPSDSDMEDRRTWALWGNRSEIVDGLATTLTSHGYGQSDSSIAHYVQEAIEDYFLRLSISEMLDVCDARYASMRDAARQHGQLERLRASLLTLSIDMSSIDRDIRAYNAHGSQRDHAQFFFEDSPYLVAEHAKHGGPSRESINMNEHLLNEQTRTLETLRAADNDYRGILTAAASLTSSLRSIRMARTAIWIAMASLVVAAVTLVITDISKHSLAGTVAHWLGLLH